MGLCHGSGSSYSTTAATDASGSRRGMSEGSRLLYMYRVQQQQTNNKQQTHNNRQQQPTTQQQQPQQQHNNNNRQHLP